MPIDRRPNMNLPKEQRASELGLSVVKRIRQTREARDLSQMALEELADLARGSLSRIESGQRASLLSVPVVLALARALKVDVGWLITGKVPTGKWRPPKLKPVRKVLPRGRPRTKE